MCTYICFLFLVTLNFEENMAKIKAQKRKRSAAKEPVEVEEVPLPSTRKSDDPIPNKVRILREKRVFLKFSFIQVKEPKFLIEFHFNRI